MQPAQGTQQSAQPKSAAEDFKRFIHHETIPNYQRQRLQYLDNKEQKKIITSWMHEALTCYKLADVSNLTELVKDWDNEDLLQMLNSEAQMKKMAKH